MYLYVLYIFIVCVTFSTTIQFILFVVTSILFCCNWLRFVRFNSMSDYLDPVFIPNQYFRTYTFYPYLKKYLAFKNKRILSIKDLPTINMQHVSIIFHHSLLLHYLPILLFSMLPFCVFFIVKTTIIANLPVMN